MPEKNQFYVYLHKDSNGRIFYIGKGTGSRAWSKDRHQIWNKYVNEHLKGEYSVEIFQDNLTENDAQIKEEELICKFGAQLVNWINPGRDFDLEAINRFHILRDKNRLFAAETRSMEETDPEEAIKRYKLAIEKIAEYDEIIRERGLVADLFNKRKIGEPDFLVRLTLCLIKRGRAQEAFNAAEQYFSIYSEAAQLRVGHTIQKRIQAGLLSNNKIRTVTSNKTLLKRPTNANVLLKIESKKVDQKKEKPGYFQGKHFTLYVDSVKTLMREKKFDLAEDLLLSLIAATERESNINNSELPPFYFEKLAILYSKTNHKELELELLEHYEKIMNCYNLNISARLAKRLSAHRT